MIEKALFELIKLKLIDLEKIFLLDSALLRECVPELNLFFCQRISSKVYFDALQSIDLHFDFLILLFDDNLNKWFLQTLITLRISCSFDFSVPKSVSLKNMCGFVVWLWAFDSKNLVLRFQKFRKKLL